MSNIYIKLKLNRHEISELARDIKTIKKIKAIIENKSRDNEGLDAEVLNIISAMVQTLSWRDFSIKDSQKDIAWHILENVRVLDQTTSIPAFSAASKENPQYMKNLIENMETCLSYATKRIKKLETFNNKFGIFLKAMERYKETIPKISSAIKKITEEINKLPKTTKYSEDQLAFLSTLNNTLSGYQIPGKTNLSQLTNLQKENIKSELDEVIKKVKEDFLTEDKEISKLLTPHIDILNLCASSLDAGKASAQHNNKAKKGGGKAKGNKKSPSFNAITSHLSSLTKKLTALREHEVEIKKLEQTKSTLTFGSSLIQSVIDDIQNGQAPIYIEHKVIDGLIQFIDSNKTTLTQENVLEGMLNASFYLLNIGENQSFQDIISKEEIQPAFNEMTSLTNIDTNKEIKDYSDTESLLLTIPEILVLGAITSSDIETFLRNKVIFVYSHLKENATSVPDDETKKIIFDFFKIIKCLNGYSDFLVNDATRNGTAATLNPTITYAIKLFTETANKDPKSIHTSLQKAIETPRLKSLFLPQQKKKNSKSESGSRKMNLTQTELNETSNDYFMRALRTIENSEIKMDRMKPIQTVFKRHYDYFKKLIVDCENSSNDLIMEDYNEKLKILEQVNSALTRLLNPFLQGVKGEKLFPIIDKLDNFFSILTDTESPTETDRWKITVGAKNKEKQKTYTAKELEDFNNLDLLSLFEQLNKPLKPKIADYDDYLSCSVVTDHAIETNKSLKNKLDVARKSIVQTAASCLREEGSKEVLKNQTIKTIREERSNLIDELKGLKETVKSIIQETSLSEKMSDLKSDELAKEIETASLCLAKAQTLELETKSLTDTTDPDQILKNAYFKKLIGYPIKLSNQLTEKKEDGKINKEIYHLAILRCVCVLGEAFVILKQLNYNSKLDNFNATARKMIACRNYLQHIASQARSSEKLHRFIETGSFTKDATVAKPSVKKAKSTQSENVVKTGLHSPLTTIEKILAEISYQENLLETAAKENDPSTKNLLALAWEYMFTFIGGDLIRRLENNQIFLENFSYTYMSKKEEFEPTTMLAILEQVRLYRNKLTHSYLSLSDHDKSDHDKDLRTQLKQLTEEEGGIKVKSRSSAHLLTKRFQPMLRLCWAVLMLTTETQELKSDAETIICSHIIKFEKYLNIKTFGTNNIECRKKTVIQELERLVETYGKKHVGEEKLETTLKVKETSDATTTTDVTMVDVENSKQNEQISFHSAYKPSLTLFKAYTQNRGKTSSPCAEEYHKDELTEPTGGANTAHTTTPMVAS